MKQDVKLYIDDKLVDFSNELNLPFTYQLEDLNNPTVVKNSFTKTITIVGTSNNNQIFGDIYNFDRNQIYDPDYLVGIYFNPSFRTPFKLYSDGEIIESGYMQLNSINIKNKIVNYEITLYGGLGDFFYNLSYNDENELLTLSDLHYGIIDDNTGEEYTSEDELTFRINKEFVYKCWDNLNREGNYIYNFINFAPCENGLYDNFDNNKVLINSVDNNISTAVTADGKTYTTYNGYAMGDLNNEYTEWEMHDLRSYYQRPVIKFSKIIQAICDEQNNGGYKVVLDEDFFNVGNPYYNKAYVTLPMLSSLSKNDENIEFTNLKPLNSLWVGVSGSQVNKVSTTYNVPNPETENIKIINTNYIDLTNFSNSTSIQINCDFQVVANVPNTNNKNLYLSSTFIPANVVDKDYYIHYNKSIIVQALLYNENDEVIGYSNPIALNNFNYTTKNMVDYDIPNGSMQQIKGHFVLQSNKYVYVNEDGNNTFRLTLTNVPKSYFRCEIKVVAQTPYNLRNTTNAVGLLFTGDKMYNDTYYETAKINVNLVDTEIKVEKGDNPIGSNSKLTKKDLLKTEKTPLDYLLSYSKLFGLMFEKDLNDRTIYIKTRNNFFTGEIKDWSNRIDYGKDVKINPILMDSKFYKYDYVENENYYLDKYKKEYGINYGQKRINTNYNFNSEEKPLLTNNIFKNSVTARNTSPYYRTFFNNNQTQIPSFYVDNFTLKLFNKTGDELNNYDITQNTSSSVNIAGSSKWFAIGGYDLFEKPSFFKIDGGKKSLADTENVLLFYTGNDYTRDINDNKVQYYLSDDVEEMITLNDNVCFLQTNSQFNINDESIALPLDFIPKFSKYYDSLGNINYSWDFGVPLELYMPLTNYSETTTLYNNFWDSYYSDKLDINTKKVTCYVNLNGITVNEKLLKDFYYFDGCNWLLNKIENYDVNRIDTVKCEFVRINNIDNYLKDNGIYSDYLVTSVSEVTISPNASSYTFTVYSSKDWEVGDYNYNVINNITPMSGGTGATEVTVNFGKNTTYKDRNSYLTVNWINNFDVRKNVFLYQAPYNSILISGKINNIGNKGSIDIFVNSSYGTNSGYMNNKTGEYYVWVPKNTNVELEIIWNYAEDTKIIPITTSTTNITYNFSI